jgi:uncharacterized membrane protein
VSLLSMAQWVQATGPFTYLRQSAYTYPIIMTLHLVGIAVFGGMILVGDLRLLGLVMRKQPLTDVIGRCRVLKRYGFALVATCGVLMLFSKAEEYYYNKFFWAKMTVLALIGVHGLVFRPSVYQNLEELDASPRIPGRAKLAAALSLLLWTGMVICGRGIGYIEPPLDKLHAEIAPPPARQLAGVLRADAQSPLVGLKTGGARNTRKVNQER